MKNLKNFTEIEIENLAREEFKNVGDEGLFPNHTDYDIWACGFIDGIKYILNKNKEDGSTNES